MRISDWSSDVCSSDLFRRLGDFPEVRGLLGNRRDAGIHRSCDRRLVSRRKTRREVRSGADRGRARAGIRHQRRRSPAALAPADARRAAAGASGDRRIARAMARRGIFTVRSEEHTSELQSLMRISYAVFCLKKKIIYTLNTMSMTTTVLTTTR